MGRTKLVQQFRAVNVGQFVIGDDDVKGLFSGLFQSASAGRCADNLPGIAKRPAEFNLCLDIGIGDQILRVGVNYHFGGPFIGE